jgi:hypothetical protein
MLSCLAFGAPNASADGACQSASGTFTSYTYYPPPCTSAIGVCMHSELSGGFPSTYDFIFDTLVNAGDASDPTRYDFTGHAVITTEHGTMTTQDTGFMHIDPTTLAPFTTHATIVDGTRRFSHVHGEFVFTGQLSLSDGLAMGSYTSNICHGGGNGDDRAHEHDGRGDHDDHGCHGDHDGD